MERHLMQHITRRIEYIRTVVYQIEKNANNLPETYERYHDPRYAAGHNLSARKFVQKLEEFKIANLAPLKNEVKELLSLELQKPIISALEIISQLVGNIESEYSKGLMNPNTAYLVDKWHILTQTRGIENNLKDIENIIKTYIK